MDQKVPYIIANNKTIHKARVILKVMKIRVYSLISIQSLVYIRSFADSDPLREFVTVRSCT